MCIEIMGGGGGTNLEKSLWKNFLPNTIENNRFNNHENLNESEYFCKMVNRISQSKDPENYLLLMQHWSKDNLIGKAN